MRRPVLWGPVSVAAVAFLTAGLVPGAAAGPRSGIADPYVRHQSEVCPDRTPKPPAPASWGMDKATGDFRFPAAAPAVAEGQKAPEFDGILPGWDTKSYIKNMKVEAFHPQVLNRGHTWQAIADFGGRRYMYHHYRQAVRVYDITDPRRLKVVAEQKYPDGFGATAIRWSPKLRSYVMIQSEEPPRFGVLESKYHEPDQVERIRNWPFKGFRVVRMDGPLPHQWKPLAKVSTDPLSSPGDGTVPRGNGSLDVPYLDERYLFAATAPDDSFALTEYPSVLHAAGQQVYDMKDPARPRLIDTWWAPGSRIGEEQAYRANPRCGDRTSWMGARMPVFMPRSPEKGGRYGYAAMGGFGMYVLDISNPSRIRSVGHVDFPPSVAGTEGDNIDVSQVERTGIVYYSGYPLNANCYEPYKHIYAVDVRNPGRPKVVSTLPVPKPPAEAGFTSYCQRRGSFGPKRTGYYTQPGTPRPGFLPYSFYSAGVQVFDVRDPRKAKIDAYFVPGNHPSVPEEERGNLVAGVYAEYDRGLLWLISDHGLYLLSSPFLGKPKFGPPKRPWPPRG